MPEVLVNGINIYYEEIGSGKPLVFVPGLGGNTTLWYYQTMYFKDYYKVITLDNRGAGRSEKPEGPYTMEMFAKDLNELLDKIGVNEKIYLVGASMGGIIAQAFMHDYPERVEKLALVCSGVSGGDIHQTKPDDEVMNILNNPGNTIEEKVDNILKVFYHSDFVKANPKLRELFLNRKIEEQPDYAYFAQLEACMDPRTYYEWLQDIKIPTMIMHGMDDVVWPIKNAETVIEGLGVKCEHCFFEKTGHIFFQEKPQEFNQALHDFLKE